MISRLSIVGFKNWSMSSHSSHQHRRTLSKNLQQMKFMKRKRDTEQQDETDSSQTQILIGERWVVPDMTSSRAGPSLVKSLRSHVECAQLNAIGRLSFHNFNKEVEKLSYKPTERSDSEDNEDEQTISAQEVSRRYQELMGSNINNKHQKKKRPKVFLKPTD